VSLSYEPYLPDKVSSGAITCPMTPGFASSRGELRCCHVPHGPQQAVDHKSKEMPSCPRHVARLACFQGLLCAFVRHATDGPLNTDETCGQTGCRVGPAQQTCSPVTVVYHNAEWFNNSGPTARSGRHLRCDCSRHQRHGPPVRHHYRPSDVTTPRRTTDRVQGDKR
jgi:hypothetical protein